MFWRSCLVLALGLVAVNGQLSCQDIDTSACVLMSQQQSDLCSNTAIAEAACKRFCNLCLVECYECTYAMSNASECNTTQVCQSGEVCMKKELKSTVDGHHEYQMSCESTATCDGSGLAINFVGKRDVQARDVTVSCCKTDLCNAPEMMTTTTAKPTTTLFNTQGCMKDVILMVDESSSAIRYESGLMQFLKEIVSNLNIGPTATHVSMATFASTAVDRWDLDTYTDKQSLLLALSRVQLKGGNGDNTVAMSYLVNKATSPSVGDRPTVPDTIILITDDISHRNVFQTTVLASALGRVSNDIITIGIGQAASSSEIDKIATDTGHSFHLRSPLGLKGLAPKILALACQ